MAFKDSLFPFANGLKGASEILVNENPTYIIAPMMGSVPFIDVMHILNEDFDASKVYYMPASSHLPDVNTLMHTWVRNFLNDKINGTTPVKIMGIDEVVSGSSAVRVYRAITKEIDNKKKSLISAQLAKFYTTNTQEFAQACTDLDESTGFNYHPFLSRLMHEQSQDIYSNDNNLLVSRQKELVDIVKTHFDALISYKGIGIEDSKIEIDSNKPRRKEYVEIRDSGAIIPVLVKAIITMDKPELCPAEYQASPINSKAYVKFMPKVSSFKVTDAYLNMLSTIAIYGGKNPADIAPVNMNRILDCSKYLE